MATPSDPILPGVVVLTRGANEVMYNTVSELGPTVGSPADTEWGFGTLANFSTLTYKTMDVLRSTNPQIGNFQALVLNKQMVMHIKSRDIYMSIMFTNWGRFGSGTVGYIRSTAPGGGNPPTVTLTNPVSGAVFAAPASINLRASVGGGTVTNVEYFAGTTSLGHATTAPFAVTGNLPNAGSYALKAVATASGLSGTSSVVNITVVSPTPVSLAPPGFSGGQFSFNYSADPGLRYVVQSSSNLLDWISLVTNVAGGTSVPFAAGLATNPSTYYRVGRLPNP